MTITYPGTIDVFTNPSGSNTQDNPDHAVQHSDANDAIEALEAVVGTTAGTSVLKNFAAGDFPARINASNVLQQPISGTISASLGTLNNMVFGTPNVTGGTLSATVYNNGTFGTPAITGGTATSINLVTPIYPSNGTLNITAKASAYQGTQQTNLSDNTPTMVNLDTETYDPGSNFASNGFVAPVTGNYFVVGNITYVQVVANKPYRNSIYINGAEVARFTQHASLADTIAVPCQGIFNITAGGTVHMYATQVTGAGTTDIQNGSLYTYMQVQLLA